MTTWFVSRHPGAIAWIKAQEFTIDRFIDHIDLTLLKAGDRVIGTLPVNVVAQLCESGIEYWHLNLELPFSARGKELNRKELEQYGAHLQRYDVKALDTNLKVVR